MLQKSLALCGFLAGWSGITFAMPAPPLNVPTLYKCTGSQDVGLSLNVFALPKNLNHPYLATINTSVPKTGGGFTPYTNTFTGQLCKIAFNNHGSFGDEDVCFWNLASGIWVGNLHIPANQKPGRFEHNAASFNSDVFQTKDTKLICEKGN